MSEKNGGDPVAQESELMDRLDKLDEERQAIIENLYEDCHMPYSAIIERQVEDTRSLLTWLDSVEGLTTPAEHGMAAAISALQAAASAEEKWEADGE